MTVSVSSAAGTIPASQTFDMTVTLSCLTATLSLGTITGNTASVNYDSSILIEASPFFVSDVGSCTIEYSCVSVTYTASPTPPIDCTSSFFTLGTSDGTVTLQPGLDRSAMPADSYTYGI